MLTIIFLLLSPSFNLVGHDDLDFVNLLSAVAPRTANSQAQVGATYATADGYLYGRDVFKRVRDQADVGGDGGDARPVGGQHGAALRGVGFLLADELVDFFDLRLDVVV